MDPKPKTTAKDFFLYLGAIVGLYWGAISLIQLVTEIINYRFPDAVNGYYSYGYSGTMRYAIASLIIVFPIFILLSWLNQRGIVANPEKRELWIRRWLVMLTLFVAGLTSIIDLVVFLNTFLGGEITTRFVLKALTVLIVALGIFAYYIWELRSSEAVSGRRKTFAISTAFVVLLALIMGFVTVGSPNTARLVRFDDQRVMDLQNIQGQIINYWQLKNKMPITLFELEDSISGWKVPVDPETAVVYEYIPKTGLTFELCATFSLGSAPDSQTKYATPYPVGGNAISDNWNHPAGRDCFSRTIDPELYPQQPRVKIQ